jgi:heme A synthase
MSAVLPRDGGRERDLLSVGAGLAATTGGLSVAIPFLTGLTFALTCIVFAVWLVGSFSRPVRTPGGAENRPTRAWFWISVVLFAGVLFLYFGAPPWLAPLRGLVLVVSPVACWRSWAPRVVRSASA